MSYDIVKAGIVGILNAQNLAESQESGSFKDAPGTEYENTFILTCTDGEAEDRNEQQASFVYDVQKWSVQVAFGKSSESEILQKDAINRKKDSLLTELDDPANWRSFCTILRYRSWKIEELESYFVLTIELKVTDALTY